MTTHVLLCRKRLERQPQEQAPLQDGIAALGLGSLPVPCLRHCSLCALHPVALIDGVLFQGTDAQDLLNDLAEHRLQE